MELPAACSRTAGVSHPACRIQWQDHCRDNKGLQNHRNESSANVRAQPLKGHACSWWQGIALLQEDEKHHIIQLSC